MGTRPGLHRQTGEELASPTPRATRSPSRAVDARAPRSGVPCLVGEPVDLDVVAIGGGFSHVTPALFELARDAVAERAAFPFVTRVAIVPSGLSGDGPLIRAAALVHRAELVG